MINLIDKFNEHKILIIIYMKRKINMYYKIYEYFQLFKIKITNNSSTYGRRF